MAFQDQTSAVAARSGAEKAVSLSIGMASPLWIVFGAAASAGAAWWWMSRWARPTNLEAVLGAPAPAPAPAQLAVATIPAVEDVVVAMEPAPEARPDELTRLFGVGPRLADALAARGVTRFAQLAAWTAEEAADFDRELSLKGRPMRDAWVEQARRLAAEG
ncbi:MAG: hypothetical protein ABI376_05180 [Caulobacteraceae bacterium]